MTSLGLLFSVKRTNIGFGLPLISVTGEIVGVFIGKRDRCSWFSPFSVTGLSAMCCLLYRFLGGISQHFSPKTCHRSVSKKTGQTNRIERFNCTMRQRIDFTFVRNEVSRMNRKSPSFSKGQSYWSHFVFYFPSLRLKPSSFRRTDLSPYACS